MSRNATDRYGAVLGTGTALSKHTGVQHILGNHNTLEQGLDPLLLQLPWGLMHLEKLLVLGWDSWSLPR